MNDWASWLTLAGFLAATFGAGSTGALFSPGEWYRRLAKPGWTPPDWLFPIAWTLLYIAMAVAAWLVTRSGSPLAFLAVALWSWQIVMNALWSPAFFGLRQIGTALVVVLFLWTAVALTTAAFLAIDAVAGYLMLPYLVWVSYASALNFAIWRMNPEAPKALAA
jgi:translocator protein